MPRSYNLSALLSAFELTYPSERTSLIEVPYTALFFSRIFFPAGPATKVSSPPQQDHHRVKRQLVTCPGYAGYCTESYPGDTCLVVCAFGRNNVPECQVYKSVAKPSELITCTLTNKAFRGRINMK